MYNQNWLMTAKNGCIFFGDLNAHHQNWGDSKSNRSGEKLVKIVYTYSLLNTGEPTFISINGSSIFDLCLIYGPFVCQYEHNATTDEYVELFTGAPNRGHLPVLVEFAVFTEKTQNKEVVDGLGLIRNKAGELLYTASEIPTQFETTFFSRKHLSKQSYDEGFFEYVKQEVRVPDSSDEHESDLFVDTLNKEELNPAIAITSNHRLFDTGGIHLSMIKKMGYKAREMSLQIFNNCW